MLRLRGLYTTRLVANYINAVKEADASEAPRLAQEPEKSSNLSITKMPVFFTLITSLMSQIFVTKFKAV